MIIGLAGYARSGKDTVGKILVEDYGFRRIALADKMKEALAILNPIISYTNDTRISDFPTDRAGTPDWEQAKEVPEVRNLLQRFGTEVGRQLFGPDFWIEQAFRGVIESHGGMAKIIGNENIVVTDVRFPNEANFIKNHHGKTFWIQRPGIRAANGHISELAMIPEMCDGVIYNNRKNYREHLSVQIGRKIHGDAPEGSNDEDRT